MRHDPRLSTILQRRASDEYTAAAPTAGQLAVEAAAREAAQANAHRVGAEEPAYAASRLGTAASLRAIDAAAGGGFYDVSEQATRDRAAAAEAFGGDGFVIDVQTHYVGRGRDDVAGAAGVLDFIRQAAPERFRGLDPKTSLSFAEYLRCVYVESETAVAVLTAAPGNSDTNILPNDDITGTQALLEQLGAGPRMLHHAIVHPNEGRELETLAESIERHRPSALKVYTLYGSSPDGQTSGWMLDDERVGVPFLERARTLGISRICAHKGLSQLAPAGSPRDVGPAASRFPDLDFLIYHSGYEIAARVADEERAHPEGVESRELRGTDRLVASLRESRVGPGSNVYAELGSTWYQLMRRPLEAAHVLGKLLLAVGESNVLWGTDSVWYGPAQPMIDAFRAFRIPERLQQEHGYPELTSELKAAVLGGNAARVYGLDPEAVRTSQGDDLAWLGEAIREQSLATTAG